ncbi:MAG: FKBP-type peptidyl-prolyl cis-trans isomerase [Bacteroidales bacterium]|jgi:FKBP-type peptidyl-prolyl cis-trans isomerase|nr:FKBP-type peptidyl-prolyl cis-trans isomerase [Bacteroidales bacterium]MDD4214598.1 FKBP-type peptidyl-prolyl cis-trans isomerase [Bacteroidales bacterium]
MKKFFALIIIITLGHSANSQTGKIQLKTFDDSVAYTIGCNIGNNLKGSLTKDSLMFNYDIISQGVNDALNGPDHMLFPLELTKAIMDNFRKYMEEKIAIRNAKNAKLKNEEDNKFLEENKNKPGILTTASGLQYKVIQQGNGAKPTMESTVTVNYEGKFIDGRVFDSSYERNQPADFPLTNLIKGFSEGILLMNEGSIYELFISSDLGYGDAGTQGIPGGSALIFKVELIKVK